MNGLLGELGILHVGLRELGYNCAFCWLMGSRALRLRYGLPIHMPSNPSSLLRVSTVPPAPVRMSSVPALQPDSKALFGSVRRTKDIPKFEFDPMMIARRSDGWDSLLESVVKSWVESVAKETRACTQEV